MVGVRGETVRNNIVEGHDIGGFALVGFCTVQRLFFGLDCVGPNSPRDGDPSANDNTIIGNKFDRNGKVGIPAFNLPGADIVYMQSQEELIMKPNGNCFDDNTSSDGENASALATNFASESMPLPTGGC